MLMKLIDLKRFALKPIHFKSEHIVRRQLKTLHITLYRLLTTIAYKIDTGAFLTATDKKLRFEKGVNNNVLLAVWTPIVFIAYSFEKGAM